MATDTSKLMDDEVPMTADDGVSPIDSINKYFFLDFNGLKRDHIRFLNFFKHSNLFDIDTPSFERIDVYNKEPLLYKTSYDEFGHANKLIELPPCIFIEDDEDLMELMLQSDGSYKLPSTLNSTQYNYYTGMGKILTNIIYLISKPNSENSISNKDGKVFNNANNSYYEYILTSIEYNNSTGLYELEWEMLGGSEGSGVASSDIKFNSLVKVTTLDSDSEASAYLDEDISDDLTTYTLNLKIPKGDKGSEVLLRVDENNMLQYSYEDSSNWNDLFNLENIRGADGTSVNIIDSLSSTKDLPTSGNTNGDGYLILGELWVYTGTDLEDDSHTKGFNNVGSIQGPKGDKGETGEQGIQGEKGKDGTDGISITKAEIVDNELILTFSDNTTTNLGNVKGEQGVEGRYIYSAEISTLGGLVLRFSDGSNMDVGMVRGTSITDISYTFTSMEADATSGDGTEKGTSDSYDYYWINFNNDVDSILISIHNGKDGDSTELRVNDDYIQWKNSSSSSWTNLIALETLKGEKGDKGETGEQGIQGEAGIQGEQGEKGDKGDDGNSIISTKIDSTGHLILTFSDETTLDVGKVVGADGNDGNNGIDGDSIELQITDDYIQWKKSSSSEWTNLIALETLKGEKGDKGETGEQGIQGEAGETGTDGKSITEAIIDSSTGHLILTFSDETTLDVGKVVGDDGKQGDKGDDGNNIESVTFVSSTQGDSAGIAGAVDTYQILLTDGNTFEFTVTNGKDGTGSESTILVDTEMSDASENAVQNKVIKSYIDDLVGDINTILDSLVEV
jgi:hypothetical protein